MCMYIFMYGLTESDPPHFCRERGRNFARGQLFVLIILVHDGGGGRWEGISNGRPFPIVLCIRNWGEGEGWGGGGGKPTPPPHL